MLDVLREEKKYGISLERAQALFFKLSQAMDGDPFNGLNSYLVRSLYFDSINDDDFFEKGEGIEYRKKIRLRVYDPKANKAKLEMKEKSGSSQRKRSLTLSRDDAKRMIAGDYSVLLGYEEELASELYYTMVTECYQPKCVVQYYRRAFAAMENNIRITFDSELTSNEGYYDIFDENMYVYPISPKDEVVLEVKYNNFLLSYIKDLLDCVDKTETSNSKYCRARKYGMLEV
ncbi:MAG: polyphosphate polymerase domain-containing protein [Lachnospiraceae bacterium]|nr:polyphosphate polymerase domain-containing protein [Lachnospiraceae bacterium]